VEELIDLIEDLANLSGDNFYSFVAVGGSAWKPEAQLALFYRRHLIERIGGNHQILLQGSSTIYNSSRGHQVLSLDWYHPTVGELSLVPDYLEGKNRRGKAADQQKELESRAHNVLESDKRLLKRFDQLLSNAREASRLREEQAEFFTLGWPTMRNALRIIGVEYCKRQIISEPDDVYFMTYEELKLMAASKNDQKSLFSEIKDRKALWQKQKDLTPPDELGKLSPIVRRMLKKYEEVLGTRSKRGEDDISGMPASAGIATGVVRVIKSFEEFENLLPGEILVAPMTGPAWTPLFSRALAVVTDTGSILAHASLIAREYGIPAIVGTGQATKRLKNGDTITVNGNTGEITIIIEKVKTGTS
ncbi:MAG TPA: PEP-utilizing enzyme, partial [Candidatus Hodarchaeales archaeon]|nr:PEP-utilizing enzyme [Candidatus Hodarchaeales archaeon]